MVFLDFARSYLTGGDRTDPDGEKMVMSLAVALHECPARSSPDQDFTLGHVLLVNDLRALVRAFWQRVRPEDFETGDVFTPLHPGPTVPADAAKKSHYG